MKPNKNRRSFLKKMGTSAALVAGVPPAISAARNRPDGLQYLNIPIRNKSFAPNDAIRIAVIGTGGMGIGDVDTALLVDGVEVVAACDLYDGRLLRAKELWGKDLFTTKDYREILQRPDIDAVINATTDHWHQKICLDAMESGKHVY